jgi:hypothetical protein
MTYKKVSSFLVFYKQTHLEEHHLQLVNAEEKLEEVEDLEKDLRITYGANILLKDYQFPSK